MAGGGSSELQELREMIDGIIADMEARIAKLEKLVPALRQAQDKAGRPPGGGGTSGGKSGSSKKKAAGKKGSGSSKTGK